MAQQTANQTKKTVAEPAADKNVELQVNFASLIEKSIQADVKQNTDAVQNAKKLLKSGELDNIENVRKAAQNMVDFGI